MTIARQRSVFRLCVARLPAFVICIIFAASADAQSAGGPATAPVKNMALPDLSWVPPEDGYDWIQLKSGEWLKGTIKAMQERDLEFDSEELDFQTFEWKNIRQVRSGQVMQIKLVDGEDLLGRVVATPEQIKIFSSMPGLEPRVVQRDQLQSFTRTGSNERDHWSGDISLGFSKRGGNTNQQEFNGRAHLQRRTPGTRVTVDYIGNSSEATGVESADNTRVSSSFDFWLTPHFYLVLPYAEYFKDPFQNISHRFTSGVGFGYDIIARPTLEWNIATGPAYLETKFDSTLPGEAQVKQSGALSLNSRFDWDITKDIDLTLEYRGLFTTDAVGESTHHIESTLSVDLTKRLSVDISFIWDRIANPKADANGVTPEQDDYRLVFGLGLEF